MKMFYDLGVLLKQKSTDLGTLYRQSIINMGTIIKPEKFVYILITEDDYILITEDESYKLIV
jgi:hypothetical protein